MGCDLNICLDFLEKGLDSIRAFGSQPLNGPGIIDVSGEADSRRPQLDAVPSRRTSPRRDQT